MTEATLKALEQQLEQELQRMESAVESSAINQGKLLNQMKESGAYREAGYKHFQHYYRDRWEERIGRAWETVRGYMLAARTVEEMEGRVDQTYPVQPVTDYLSAKKLHAIEEPAERVRVWNEHVESGEKRAGYQNLDRRIKEAKGEPVVRDVLTPEDMADLPAAEFNRAEEKASLTSKIVPKSTDDPEEAAEAAYRLYGENIDRHIRWADDIANWYAKYRDELIARQRQGIRAVK